MILKDGMEVEPREGSACAEFAGVAVYRTLLRKGAGEHFGGHWIVETRRVVDDELLSLTRMLTDEQVRDMYRPAAEFIQEQPGVVHVNGKPIKIPLVFTWPDEAARREFTVRNANEAAPDAVKPGDWLASLDSKQRKECAISRGFMAYFPDAIALVARHSVRMNEKHNPGEPVHWARAKSSDQPDCEARHAIATAVDPDVKDADGAYEMVCKAWRAMADLQEWAEAKHGRGERIE